MANAPVPTTIEDVLAQYVGYTVGVGEQSADSGGDDNPNADSYTGKTPPSPANGLKLATIENGGAGKWFTVIGHDEYWSANQGNKPPSQEGALTFWRRMGSDAFANWEYIQVGITTQSKTSDKTNQAPRR